MAPGHWPWSTAQWLFQALKLRLDQFGRTGSHLPHFLQTELQHFFKMVGWEDQANFQRQQYKWFSAEENKPSQRVMFDTMG